MYSKQEASQLRQEFWTTFGRYMMPVLSAEGEKINWVNYKTGEKCINFKMEASNRSARISIVINHKHSEIRELYFLQFVETKKLLQEALNEEWIWQRDFIDEHNITVSKIYKELVGASIFERKDWPDLISFFKPRIIALDLFWSSAKYGFEALR